MERLNIPFEVKEINESSDYYEFEGYASTFGNIDLVDDRIEQGAFKKSINKIKKNAVAIKNTVYKKLIPVLWQHDSDEPIGSFVNLKEDDTGLYVKGIMPKDDTLVSGRVMPQMKVGSISKMSIGFIIKGFEIVTEKIKGTEQTIRVLKEIDLWETSLVTFPANTLASVTDFKAATSYENLPLASDERQWDAATALTRVREWANATETPNQRYRRAFFWYDRENRENFGAYKLPFADVIDGGLKAVPRGIFAAAAAIQGARGGVNIPDSEKQSVINHIERYYDKMNRTSPFQKSIFKIDDISVLNVRQIENIMTSGIKFTVKDAKTIISYIKPCLYRDGVDNVRDEQVKLAEIINEINKI